MEREMVPKAMFEMVLSQLSMLQNQMTRMQETIEKMAEELRKKDAIIEEKNQIILNANRARFGQSSEQRKYVLSDGQLSMFDITGDGNTEKTIDRPESADGKKTVMVAAHERKAKRTLAELAANIPVKEEIIDLPEDQKFNEQGEPLKCIGKNEVRSELIREREKVYLRKYFVLTYADPKAEAETGEAVIIQAQPPAPLIPHSYASASAATDVFVKKYMDALPLYRQEQIWKRYGVDLNRGTLANWVITLAEMYLKIIWKKMKEYLLMFPVIHADETVLQVNKEPGRTPQQESRIWAYSSSKRAKFQIRLFQYEKSRRGACATNFLDGFAGILVTDGYSGYGVIGDIIRAACWAHMRRKWLEAMPKGATVENSKAAKGYEFCGRIFDVERMIEHLSDAERAAKRQELIKPIIDEYYAWIETIFKPSGKLKEAVTYAVNQKEYLCTFLYHGEVEASNNQVLSEQITYPQLSSPIIVNQQLRQKICA
ncbi:MAG: IS66 family transposase [Clostridia bacterium]|nr:IS66 family transposase [Clostridia bacterium]